MPTLVFDSQSYFSQTFSAMKYAVLGSGGVGQSIAKGLLNLGYEVMIATRDNTKPELLELHSSFPILLKIGSFEDAAKWCELAFLSTKWDGTENAIHLTNPENLAGKVVIDITNPLDFTSGMPPKLYIGHTNSGGATIQRLLPKSHVVKTLNIINANNMVNPIYTSGIPIMLLCGNHEEAKKTVSSILKQFGWQDIQDLGSIEQSSLMESLCILWVTYGLKNNTWNHGFAILKN
jgi:8-hydroxy-5-deazaflavin:NADPH oxidoreductase